MERILTKKLLKWRDGKRRKPLIIHGARQTGKTWLMKDFGKRFFEDMVYISFDNNPDASAIFEQDYDIKRIISSLKILHGHNFQAENTLIILDEIQECPRALTALKYFCEEAPEYYIVGAGSLLGLALHQGTSFPVGKVDFLHIYPMNFNEFVMAVENRELFDALKDLDFGILNSFSNKLTDILKRYYYVGGMPEAVLTYKETGDMTEVRRIQNNLLIYYESDFSKHAPAKQIPRIQMVWDSIPSQLAKENRKFIYGLIREGARAKDYELAIKWLEDYGLIIKSRRVKKLGLPLISYAEQSSFKLYMMDTGLLCAKGRLSAETIISGNRIFEEFKGALTEQFIAQELSSNENELYYFSTDNSTGEIDFIVQTKEGCVPVEVKAEENLKAQSLKAFCRKHEPKTAIRTSLSGYREQEWMVNVPLYMFASYINSL